MRRFFDGLIIGIILGVVGYWFVQKKAVEHPDLQQQYETAAANAKASASQTATNMSDALKAKLATLDLRADQIRDELARTGKIVRRRAEDLGNQVADTATDARIVTAIKAKYALDQDLSVWKISVSCSGGHVTISGTVQAPEDIGRAVALALEVDGVRDVVSTLQIRS